MKITAKVTCNGKNEYGQGADRYATLGFCPNYQDGRNKEWANSTPHIDIRMTVKGSVGDHFEQGKKYTLTWSEED